MDRYEILKKYLKYLLFSSKRYYVPKMFNLLKLINHNEGKDDIMISYTGLILHDLL